MKTQQITSSCVLKNVTKVYRIDLIGKGGNGGNATFLNDNGGNYAAGGEEVQVYS